MATFSEISCTCAKCGGNSPIKVYSSVNTAENPELKEDIRNGRAFVWECPVCGTANVLNRPFLYTDPELKIIILLTGGLNGEGLSSSGEVRGYTTRQVASVGELIEKIKIFEAGLDDIAVEMCKYVTARELGKDVDLKFYKMEGADQELTLTYPEKGRMEMLEIGFNVYQDCCGILSRNPVIYEKAKGLVRVDQAWLSNFIG